MAAATISNIYQFKIVLKRCYCCQCPPQIWRRIQVPENYNFYDLHVAIQDVMGWQDYHLHKFEMRNPMTQENTLIGIPDKALYPNLIPEKLAKISNYFTISNNKANYVYDFGDWWQHEILLESILPPITDTKYPQCIEGKMACPPEDCGGFSGYDYLVEVIADPQHEEYAERLQWLEWSGAGSNFNSVNFDPKTVKFDDPEERWKVAFQEF